MQSNTKQPQQNAVPVHYDEEILVINCLHLFANIQPWQGVTQNTHDCMNAIKNHPSFMPRSHAETNTLYKQIIPYILFM